MHWSHIHKQYIIVNMCVCVIWMMFYTIATFNMIDWLYIYIYSQCTLMWLHHALEASLSLFFFRYANIIHCDIEYKSLASSMRIRNVYYSRHNYDRFANVQRNTIEQWALRFKRLNVYSKRTWWWTNDLLIIAVTTAAALNNHIQKTTSYIFNTQIKCHHFDMMWGHFRNATIIIRTFFLLLLLWFCKSTITSMSQNTIIYWNNVIIILH